MQSSEEEAGHVVDAIKTTKQDLIRQGLVQRIVSVGFSDSYIRSPPEFRVLCSGFGVLEDCAEIIGPYNEFDPGKIKAAEPIFREFFRNFPLAKLSIGRENSPVIYMSSFAIDFQDVDELKSRHPELTPEQIKSECELFRPYSDFREICERIAKELLAEECGFSRESIKKICRIWWD